MLWAVSASCTKENHPIADLVDVKEVEALKTRMVESRYGMARYIQLQNEKSRGRIGHLIESMPHKTSQELLDALDQGGMIDSNILLDYATEWVSTAETLRGLIGEEAFNDFFAQEYRVRLNRALQQVLPRNSLRSAGPEKCYDDWEKSQNKLDATLLICALGSGLFNGGVSTPICAVAYTANSLINQVEFYLCLWNSYYKN